MEASRSIRRTNTMVALYPTSSQSQAVQKGPPNLRAIKFTNLIQIPNSKKPTTRQSQEEQEKLKHVKHPRDLGELLTTGDSINIKPKQTPGEPSRENWHKSQTQHSAAGSTEIAGRGKETYDQHRSLEPQQQRTVPAAAKQHHHDKDHRPEKRYTTEEIIVDHTKPGKTASRLSQKGQLNGPGTPESANAPPGAAVRTKRSHPDLPTEVLHQLEKQHTAKTEVTQRRDSGRPHEPTALHLATPSKAQHFITEKQQQRCGVPPISKPRKRLKHEDHAKHHHTDRGQPQAQITNLSLIQRHPTANGGGKTSGNNRTATTPSVCSQLTAPGKLESTTLNKTTNIGSQNRHQEASTLWPPTDKNLLTAVKAALAWTPKRRTQPIFDFTLSREAAEKNFQVLEHANFDLEKLLLSDGLSPLMPGSEFRPVSLLSPISRATHTGTDYGGRC